MLPLERQALFKTLSNLPLATFEEVIFALNLPGGILPDAKAPQGERTAGLLAWAENQGSGLKAVQVILSEVLGKPLPEQDQICPYKGLAYFDCNDQDYQFFYGRAALTETLLQKLKQNNFLAIVGASGSGKSSVLRAGLLQQLKDQGGYEIRILVPGEHPLQSLALAYVEPTAEHLDRAEQQQRAKKLINQGHEGLCALVETSTAERVVLVVDQFEEAFTLCPDKAERQAFFETLLGALAAIPSKLTILLAMRSDFVGKCFEADYGGLAEKVQHNLMAVLPMKVDELTQAITEPARQTGSTLEPGLVEAMLKDLEQSPGSLPLLQYTLTELWHRQQDHQLKLSTYIQLGGVTGTLQKRADEVYEALTPEQQTTAKHIFLNLTQLGEGSEDTRRRISQASLLSSRHPEPQVMAVVQRLADANLVVTDDLGGQAGQRQATVDVTHEALIRSWPKLRQWLEENRDRLRQQRRIEQDAQEWDTQHRQPGYLRQSFQLLEAKRFLKQHGTDFPLSALASIYLHQSIRQQRLNRLRTASWLVIPALLIGGVVEYNLREAGVQADYAALDQAGTYEEKLVAQDLVQGCVALRRYAGLPPYVSERLFGNCRSLSRSPLSEATLNSADLSFANLFAANLSSADLNGAYLSYTDLRFTDLSDADLSDADLSDAKLNGAKLNGAKLNGADLSDADLRFADLRDTDLRDTDLNGARLRDTDLRDADLRDADLSIANLSDTDLSNANLSNANLSNADLSDADLSDADLSDADLSDADLSDTIFLSTDLRTAQNLRPEQLTGDHPPYLCNSPLPQNITGVDKDRDCDKLAEILLKRYSVSFLTLEDAQEYVNQARQRRWDE